MFENVKIDLRTYWDCLENFGTLKRTFYFIFTQELYGVLIYRLGRWSHYNCHIPVIKPAIKILYFFLRKISQLILGIGISPEAEISSGLKIEHWGGIYIKGKIGKNCHISEQVVIGHIGGFKGGGVPTIGNNVYIGSGAKVLGEITIGNNVIIGANAVVIKNVPDNGVAVGVPAKVVKYRTDL